MDKIEKALILGVNSASRLNLSGSDLSNLNLSGANLNRADLSHADLKGTDLSQTSLRGANLEGTILRRANLRGADLGDAILRNADLKEAILQEVNLNGLDMSDADLRGVDFHEVSLEGTDLSGALLCDAVLNEETLKDKGLRRTNLNHADLHGANLRGAFLKGADLSQAELQRADLSGADLSWANLSGANLTDANLTGCRIYGIAAWDMILKNTTQLGLVITKKPENDDDEPEPLITVDNLEVAQFINLLRDNQKIGGVIDEITSKVVLILGRFTKERKPVLDALRKKLHEYNLSPVIFDFKPSPNRNLTETASLLASISHFVIVDLTAPKSVPQELYAIIPHLPSVPVQPILQYSEPTPFPLFDDYNSYPWVLPIHSYQDIPDLIASIKEHIIVPAEQKKHEIKSTRMLEERIRGLEEEKRQLKEKVRKLELGEISDE